MRSRSHQGMWSPPVKKLLTDSKKRPILASINLLSGVGVGWSGSEEVAEQGRAILGFVCRMGTDETAEEKGLGLDSRRRARSKRTPRRGGCASAHVTSEGPLLQGSHVREIGRLAVCLER